MDSIGETLRDARHRKQVSLEDASRVTKIKTDLLEHLEADDYSNIPSPTYVKGFLKLYAEYLGLDPGSVVEGYVKSQGGLRRQGLHIETVAATRKSRLGELKLPIKRVVIAVAGMTAIVLVVTFVYSWWSHRPEKPAPLPAAPVTLPTADFDGYYQPKQKPAPELLDLSGK